MSRVARIPAGEATPAGLGYRMPAEWEPHRATWLAWPHERTDWPGKFPAIPWVFAEIVRWISRGETAELIVRSRRALANARAVLDRSDVSTERVRFHLWPTDRSWTRDSGPTFVLRTRPGNDAPRLATIHWKFNAWAKYGNWKDDRKIPERIAALLGVPRWAAMVGKRWVVLEGGAIDGNGRGTFLATQECLLGSPQPRNPGLGRRGIEGALAAYLGSKRMIWLPGGIRGDDTHGHVDDVVRFVSEDRVVAVSPRSREDPNRRMLERNLEVLSRARDGRGRPLRVVELPSPEEVRFDGETLPASYANFYIANRSVLVPTFGDPADAEALSILRGLFPQRTVVGVPARDLVWGLGAVHCLTQQEPAIP